MGAKQEPRPACGSVSAERCRARINGLKSIAAVSRVTDCRSHFPAGSRQAEQDCERRMARTLRSYGMQPRVSAQTLSSTSRMFFVALIPLAMSACGRKTLPSAPPPEVLVTEVNPEDVPIYDDFVGTLEPSVNASIQARVQGYLISQNYEEG